MKLVTGYIKKTIHFAVSAEPYESCNDAVKRLRDMACEMTESSDEDDENKDPTYIPLNMSNLSFGSTTGMFFQFP